MDFEIDNLMFFFRKFLKSIFINSMCNEFVIFFENKIIYIEFVLS